MSIQYTRDLVDCNDTLGATYTDSGRVQSLPLMFYPDKFARGLSSKNYDFGFDDEVSPQHWNHDRFEAVANGKHHTDAHAKSYFICKIDEADGKPSPVRDEITPVQDQVRVNKNALPLLEEDGFTCYVSWMFIDVDLPDHAAWESKEQAQETLSKLRATGDEALSSAGFYSTKHGYRLVWPIIPMHADRFEWFALQFFGHLETLGLEPDRACKDWTRLMRLPLVTRDGVKPDPSSIVADYAPMQVLTWEPSEDYPGRPTKKTTAPTKGSQGGGLEERRNALGLLSRGAEACRVSKAGEGNATLNKWGFTLGGLVRHDLLTADEVRHYIIPSIVSAGYPETEARAVLDSALGSATPAPLEWVAPRPRDTFAHWRSVWMGESWTDMGMSSRLVNHFDGEFLFVADLPGNHSWLQWGGSSWNPLSEIAITAHVMDFNRDFASWSDWSKPGRASQAEMAKETFEKDNENRAKFARRIQSNGSINSARSLWRAELDREHGLGYSDLNGSDLRIPCEGSTLVVDLANETVDVMEPCRDDLFTNKIDIKYDPEAKSPTWERFISEATCGREDLGRYLQKLAGLSLTGITRDQAFWIFKGVGNDGKSVYKSVLEDVLKVGGFAGTLPITTLLDNKKSSGGHSDDIASIAGRRWIGVSETNPGDRIDESLIKSLTGEDIFKASFKGEKNFDFRPKAKFVILTNHKLRVRASKSIKRRIRVIPWDNSISEGDEDINLKDKIMAEREGVFAWMVEGLKIYLAEGFPKDVSDCPEVKKATDDYMGDMDPFGRFMEDSCIVDQNNPAMNCKKSALLAAFQLWCSGNAERMWGAASVKSEMKDTRLFDDKRTNRGWVWMGLSLKPEVAEEVGDLLRAEKARKTYNPGGKD